MRFDGYSGGDENNCLSLYTINEEYDKPGEHVWFSEAIEGITPNEIMWNFFNESCSTSSSVIESNEILTEIFLNPVQQGVHVKNSLGEEYRLYDLNGKLILIGQIKSQLDQISMKDLNPGYYTIQIGKQISKLLKVE